jgi:hypothetical protein
MCRASAPIKNSVCSDLGLALRPIMSLESVVRNKVRKLLSSVDLDTTTQRTIQQQLEDDLGVDLDEYKDILKSEIDAFLLGQVDANAAQQQHQPAVQFDDGDDEFVDTHPAKKQKQAAKPATAPPYKAVAAPSDASEGPPGYSYSIPISSKRYLGVRVYNKRPMVDCRCVSALSSVTFLLYIHQLPAFQNFAPHTSQKYAGSFIMMILAL